METAIFVILAVVIIGMMVLKRLSYIKPEQARSLVEQGAAIVDVRSASEYSGGHLGSAVNVPLDELEGRSSAAIPSKQTPVLVYCLSGTRSAMAVRTLKRLGYSTVENLGSFSRANKLVGQK